MILYSLTKLSTFYSYCERDECNTLMDLLEGYDQGDGEQLNRALNSPFIKHMDVEVNNKKKLN